MKKILILLLTITGQGFACDCPPLEPLARETTGNYDVIFRGMVQSISACDEKGKAVAVFNVSELYKGSCGKMIEVRFECASDCLMSFAVGEEWIIYSRYEKFDQLFVEICSHSRKRFADPTADIYALGTSRGTFDKEAGQLLSWLGLQKFAEPNDLQDQHDALGARNEQPSGMSKIFLLLISLAAMGAVWLFTRKKK